MMVFINTKVIYLGEQKKIWDDDIIMSPLKSEKMTRSMHSMLITNLQKLLAEQKINETELSRQTHIPQPTIHKIFSGKTTDPRISTLQILADYFHTTIDALYSSHLPATRASLQSKWIPLMTWHDCRKLHKLIPSLVKHHWPHWIVTESHPHQMYALKTKTSMEPRFARGTILIVDIEKEITDGEFIVVHYPNTQEATLRQLSSDGPTQLLMPLNEGLGKPERLNKSIQMLGVITQSRFLYKDAGISGE